LAVSDASDADQVARGIADGAVADTVRLLGRLLGDFGVAGLQPREGALEVVAGQKDPAVGALGHHLGDVRRSSSLMPGSAAGGPRRMEVPGWSAGADRDPAQLAVSDVAADLEAEAVAIEGQGGVRVVVREETRVNGDVHAGHDRCGSRAGASRFLIGLVTCFARHDGIPAVARAAWRRWVLGGRPTSSVKRMLKVPSDEQPTAKQTWVTLRSPRRSSAIARSMRRVIR
jgi:hypothetical protein